MRTFLVPALLVAGLAAPDLRGQTSREVTGKVMVLGTKAPLPSATVGVAGQPETSRTNERGEFRLRIPEGSVTLFARAIGYKRSSQVVAAASTTADFALESDALLLDGMTITGAATTIDRRNAATAVEIVGADELTRAPAPSLESALQAKVIGASINMNNGAPGGGGQIQIRGASSLTGRIDPLFVVDGVIVSNAIRSNHLGDIIGSSNPGEENGTNRLADLNANDIESIEVLKSTAASAIYGSQATNGVVVITTKRGRAGAPRLTVTQRIGTYQLMRNRGSRRFTDLAELLPVIGDNADAQALARASCTPQCPYHDYVGELYGRTAPSRESIASLSGGANSTSYLASVFWRDEAGTAAKTGARRLSLRGTLDQTIGTKLAVGVMSNVLHSFSQRGVSNNDNTFASPLYAFAYTPAIADLRHRDALGNYLFNPFPPGGIDAGANPFQTFDLLRNDEDVYRFITAANVSWAAWSAASNSMTVALHGGVDRFSNENYLLAPTSLQFEQPNALAAGGYPGAAIQGNGTGLLTNLTLSAVWRYAPSRRLNTTTSAGLQREDRGTNNYDILGFGLAPNQTNAAGAAITSVDQSRTSVRNDAFFAQEELLGFGDRLYLSGALRGERSSVNGNQHTLYFFPRAQTSFRFLSPFRWTDEVKLRAAIGASGNQPNYSDRYLTVANVGLVDGRPGFATATTAGNPYVKPERLIEKEFGLDASFFHERARVEATHFNRTITDLLVRPRVGPSSGITTTVVNGGKLASVGTELGAHLVAVDNGRLTWTTRASYATSTARIVEFPAGLLPFTLTQFQGGYGNMFGVLRFTPGYTVSTIFGRQHVVDAAAHVDSVVQAAPLGDANPRFTMQFGNDVSYKRFTFSMLVDHRHGGDVANMTLGIYDEGQNSWDYTKPSPVPTKTLGQYRYDEFSAGQTGVYIMDGSYTKVREISVALELPPAWYAALNGVRGARASIAGRNLWTFSKYNGADPEVSDSGNQVARFIDLAPWPPSRSVFLSLELRL